MLNRLARPASLTCDQGHTAAVALPNHPTAAEDQMLAAARDHQRVCEATQVVVRLKESRGTS